MYIDLGDVAAQVASYLTAAVWGPPQGFSSDEGNVGPDEGRPDATVQLGRSLLQRLVRWEHPDREIADALAYVVAAPEDAGRLTALRIQIHGALVADTELAQEIISALPGFNTPENSGASLKPTVPAHDRLDETIPSGVTIGFGDRQLSVLFDGMSSFEEFVDSFRLSPKAALLKIAEITGLSALEEPIAHLEEFKRTHITAKDFRTVADALDEVMNILGPPPEPTQGETDAPFPKLPVGAS